MARIKFDVRGVEGKRTTLPAGVYNVKVVGSDITHPDGKEERIELVVEVYGDKDHNGAKLYEYISVEPDSAQKWKLREFLEAIGEVTSKKESGTLDTAKLLGKRFGVKTFVRGADDAKGFDEQARIRRMFQAEGAVGKGTEEDLDDDELDDDDEEGSEYSDMSPGELRAELTERGLSTKGKSPVLIARLLEDDEESDDDDDDDEEGYSWEDIAGLTRAELRELNKEEELGVKFTKSKTDEELAAEVAGALDIDIPEDDEDEDDEDVDEDADDYDEWDDDDLREELEQRSLSTKGSTKLLVKRLRADDSEEEKPF